ncbi:arginine ABC transporter substrate-binding protein [Legionella geestiana]|uniref:Arginine ABC transporter substrate-binding protein n=1 Tax=Legionella geestiana TaxID=45065 RepID=A0A0W0TVG0_9GAMM|nr:transporter substrate-binding domain-containing protein [Legionella geestiana]KTC99697.1 arginine ABC transporter substrate-binding protein [Legionella geestiana]QBS13180.1 transporter substrate-binding domain-containing protein [Legionella geestiana]STX54300.1 arginine ABC transporter substrate-binding protein [Legionella geestiana]
MMHWLKGCICALFMVAFQTQAADEQAVLRIATTFNTPPFVMQGAGERLFGFDVVMMNHLCRQMQRTCRFVMMPFNEMLPAVEQGQVDMAVSAIIITPERAKKVLFSIPYMPSEYRFLALSSKKTLPESPTKPANQRIGLQMGSAYINALKAQGISEKQVVVFSRGDEVINALTQNKIDLAVLDNHSALYWKSISSGIVQPLWKARPIGGGFAIAVRPDAPNLQKRVNDALREFMNSPLFQKEYDKYLMRF